MDFMNNTSEVFDIPECEYWKIFVQTGSMNVECEAGKDVKHTRKVLGKVPEVFVNSGAKEGEGENARLHS